MSILRQTWAWEPETWEVRLDQCDEEDIRQTGLSRVELKEIVRILYDHRIVN